MRAFFQSEKDAQIDLLRRELEAAALAAAASEEQQKRISFLEAKLSEEEQLSSVTDVQVNSIEPCAMSVAPRATKERKERKEGALALSSLTSVCGYISFVKQILVFACLFVCVVVYLVVWLFGCLCGQRRA